METVPIFDWLRFVEVPIWGALAGWIWCHQRSDNAYQIATATKLGEVEGLKDVVGMLLDKLIPDRKE